MRRGVMRKGSDQRVGLVMDAMAVAFSFTEGRSQGIVVVLTSTPGVSS